ncbi:hypothetical protein Tco_1094003 [Tanacetum coccineum]|uniref:Uncharacterized protein n=1 Tax=Tanacetum coccineum TaxID=301880 RepID=A0ABQ5IEV1_9ASTR
MPRLVKLAINKDREVSPVDISGMVSKEFATHGPKLIEELFRKHMQNTTLNFYPKTKSSTATTLSDDLQQQLYLSIKTNPQDQAVDPEIWEILKANYRIISSHEATMRITKGNDPLNVVVDNKFRLNTLGFSEWLECVITKAKALGIPPTPELSTFKVSVKDMKRKRTLEILQEVFVKENIVVDGMHRNLIPPPGVVGSKGQVIREPESSAIQRGTPEAEEMIKKLEMTIEVMDDVNQAKKIIQDNLDGLGQYMLSIEDPLSTRLIGIKGLAECKTSASNLRCIQVKDIVKEVEDHLKTYSSAGMDMSWYVEGIRCGSKESQRWQYSDYPITL